MADNILKILKELIETSEPFTSGDIVDETNGTIPLMERLELALQNARKELGE